MIEIVINRCYGGFGLSDTAYERLIELGVPVRKYIEDKRGKDGLFKKVKNNEGEVIFDRELTPLGENALNDIYFKNKGRSRLAQRYWETWIDRKRTDKNLIRVVKELGRRANGRFADLAIVEIPDDAKWEISEYDGIETIEEVHKSWA